MAIFQSLWIGDKLPKLHFECIQSFIKHNHEYNLYSYNNLLVPTGCNLLDANEILLEDCIFTYPSSAYNNKKIDNKGYAAFSNMFRYKLLADKGGIWADTDIFCLKNFSINEPYCFVYERVKKNNKKVCASCLISCPANSEFINYCYDYCVKINKDKLKWGQIGVNLLTKAINKFNLNEYIVDASIYCPIDWWFFDNLNAIVPESRTVHLWNEMWRRQGWSSDLCGDKEQKFINKLIQYN